MSIDRCSWCLKNEKMIKYHDEEWGVPLFDDKKHFEFLMFEVLQCGLNWNIVLQKREIFQSCFDNFDFEKVAKYDDLDVQRILNTPNMIRSERKIRAIIFNANKFIEIIKEYGSLSDYIWSFSDKKTIVYEREKEYFPVSNALSEKIAKDLRKRKFKFLGAVTIYSYLESCGIINDHLKSCFRYDEINKMADVIFLKPDNEK